MQKDLQFLQKAQASHFSDEVGDSNMHSPFASAFDAVFPPCAKPMPFHGVELQPSVVCPKNFIIFDQTYDRNQVTYHPELTRKLNSPALDAYATTFQNNYAGKYSNNFEQEASSSLQEDSDEIDALLGLDEEEEDDDEEEEEYDEEEVSTARTCRDYGNLSLESCCSGYSGNNPRKSSFSGNISSNNGDKKRQKMKKMMRVLRGIVPGGEQMNTASVLDEAVQYLKSLKVEAQKLGVGNFTSQHQA